jgi:hypothetical protein
MVLQGRATTFLPPSNNLLVRHRAVRWAKRAADPGIGDFHFTGGGPEQSKRYVNNLSYSTHSG